MNNNEKYDYIIAGCGCSGMSLLYRILTTPTLKSKKILVIDKTKKNNNDRTWCYWEKKNGVFDEIVIKKWKSLQFFSHSFTKKFNLKKYTYKMIKGVDFYSFVLNFSKKFKNVTFKKENILRIETTNQIGLLISDKSKYCAEYIFNSTNLLLPKMTSENSILQHFEGWFIKSKEDLFDSKTGRLMDFRVSQKHGTTFMYLLPITKNEALIEYTLFSEKTLKKNEYEIELKKYISKYLKIDNYEIIHKEYGVIPMSMVKFERNHKLSESIINIRTAGGYTKASSGYTFQFIQKNSELIIQNLLKNKRPSPKKSIRDKIFEWYDRTLIEVLISKQMTGREVFTIMFKKNNIDKILAFLANESAFKDDLKIMTSLPSVPFLISGFKHLFKTKF